MRLRGQGQSISRIEIKPLHLYDALWCHCCLVPPKMGSNLPLVASLRCTVVPLLQSANRMAIDRPCCIYTMHCGATVAWAGYEHRSGLRVASIRCTVAPLLRLSCPMRTCFKMLHPFNALLCQCYTGISTPIPESLTCCIHSMHCGANVTGQHSETATSAQVASIQCTVVPLLRTILLDETGEMPLHLFNALWCHCCLG